MPDDTTKSEAPSAPAKKRKKAPAKAKAPKAPKMPDELREGKLPPAEFLRRAAVFLAQIGVLAIDRKDLRERMRKVRQDLSR